MTKSSRTPKPPQDKSPMIPPSQHGQGGLPPELVASNTLPLLPDVMGRLRIHQGPIPPASEFGAYDKVLSGSADRILKMAEREQKASIRLRKLNWLSEFTSMLLGKGFLYVLLLATVYLIVKGKSTQALLTGIAPAISVVYSTLFGEKRSVKDRAGKSS